MHEAFTKYTVHVNVHVYNIEYATYGLAAVPIRDLCKNIAYQVCVESWQRASPFCVLVYLFRVSISYPIVTYFIMCMCVARWEVMVMLS